MWVLFQSASSSASVYLPTRKQPGRVALINPRTGKFDGRALNIGETGDDDSFVAAPTRAWIGDFDHSTVTAIGLTPRR